MPNWTPEEYQTYVQTGKVPAPKRGDADHATNANSAKNASGHAMADSRDETCNPFSYDDCFFIVGIDPGTTTGLCVFRPGLPKTERVVTINDFSIIAVLDMIGKIDDPHQDDNPFATLVWQASGAVQFVVEDNRDDPVYDAKRRAVAGSGLGAKLNMARRIGMADAYTGLILDALTEKLSGSTDVRVIGMPSPKKSGVFPVSKWDQATFERVTGCAERTNQHKRDAARIACSAYPELLLS